VFLRASTPVPAGNIDDLIKKEEIPGLAVKIAGPEVKILANWVFEYERSTKRARA